MYSIADTDFGDAGSHAILVPAANVADCIAPDVMAGVDAWIRRVIALDHPILGKPTCPFVAPALQRDTLFYSAITGCRSPDDVISVMDDLVEQFIALPPLNARDGQLKTLVAVFVDVMAADAERVVIAAHRDLKSRCVERGLMVGEFAPGYFLPSTHNSAINVGEAPAPVLALRYMLPSDRRFLVDQDDWLAAWAARFGADRVRLFRTFSKTEMAAITRASSEVNVEPGRILCEQDQPGHELFLILDGKASVHRNGRWVCNLGPGEYFGELALLTSRPRNATVTALSTTHLLVLSRREFRNLIRSTPTMAEMLLAGLAERLSDADLQSVQS